MASILIGKIRPKVEDKPTKRRHDSSRLFSGGPAPPPPGSQPDLRPRQLTSDILSGGVGFAASDLSQEVRMKKVLLVLTLVGLGFLAWRYFSNEPV